MKVYCSECFRPIDTKRNNVGRDNRLVVCPDCTQNLCATVPKDKILQKLPNGNFKQRKRNRR